MCFEWIAMLRCCDAAMHECRANCEFKMSELADLQLAGDCLKRARDDVGMWLAHRDGGRLANLAPFAQMFVYQLNARGKCDDSAFAIEDLYRTYYRRAGGPGEAPMPAALRDAASMDEK
jgi:hypothetical protein